MSNYRKWKLVRTELKANPLMSQGLPMLIGVDGSYNIKNNEFVDVIEINAYYEAILQIDKLKKQEEQKLTDLKAKYQKVENVRRILYELSTRCKCEISSRNLDENRRSFERLNVLIDDAIAELGEKE